MANRNTNNDSAVELLKKRLSEGMDPNMIIAGPQPILSLAIELRATPDIITTLLNAGANPNKKGFNDLPPLTHLLINYDNHSTDTIELVKNLLNNGADPNLAIRNPNPTFDGYTALFVAITTPNPNPELVKLLLEKGANPNASFRGTNILMNIVSNQSNVEILNLMIKHGADINARDPNGLTPLMYSTYNKEKPELMITELLNNGANPQLTDNKGHNASDYITNCLNLSSEQKVLLSLKCAKYQK